tara:strand:- start:208 stop:456 length:249 start_codon:yes stop_codon:yes gene_type:complete
MPKQRSFFKINPETRTVVQVSPTLSDGIVLSEGEAKELAGNLMNAIEDSHHIKLEPIPESTLNDLDISLETIERLKREFGNA